MAHPPARIGPPCVLEGNRYFRPLACSNVGQYFEELHDPDGRGPGWVWGSPGASVHQADLARWPVRAGKVTARMHTSNIAGGRPSLVALGSRLAVDLTYREETAG